MLFNRPRCQAVLNEHRLDALVATQPVNVMYLADFFSLSHWFISGTQLYALVEASADRAPTVIMPMVELDQVVHLPPKEIEVIPVGRFIFAGLDNSDVPADARHLQSLISAPSAFTRALDALIDLIQQRGLAAAHVGVDEAGMIPSLLKELRAALPRMRISPASALFKQIRAVKTSEEIRRLEKAVQATEAGIKAAVAAAREGMTEREMVAVYETELVRRGARPFLSVIGFGCRSTFPNNPASDNRLRRGDIIRFDVGCSFAGYATDTARIAVFGQPDERTRLYQDALIAGEEAALAAIRPGLPARDIFPLAVAEVRRTIPHYDRSHVGHGIGLDVYEPPVLTAEAEGELLEGMVLCVETPYYEFGLGGLQVEDTIIVTPDGCRQLTSLPKQLILID